MSRIGIMSVLAAVSLTACSDFTSSGDPLSAAEAADLAGVIVEEGFVGFGGAMPAPPVQAAPGTASAPADKITININDSAPCNGGGTVSLSGKLEADFNQQAQTGSINYEYSLAPAACVVTAESGKVFTLTGDPRLNAKGELNLTSTSFDGSLEYDGKIRWESDGKSGVCGIKITAAYELSMNGDNASGAVSVDGQVCGVSVDRSLEYES